MSFLFPEFDLHALKALARSYKRHTPVVGIVYMNDITQKRMAKPTELTLALSATLGGGSSSSVVLATSQWDSLTAGRMGETREQELRASLPAAGMQLMRIERKPADQHAIVDYLLGNLVGQRL